LPRPDRPQLRLVETVRCMPVDVRRRV
jgi:hypothetical protein